MGKTNYFMKLALICGVTFILSFYAGVMWTHKDHNKMYVYVNNLSNGQTHVENTMSYKKCSFPLCPQNLHKDRNIIIVRK